MEQINSVIEMGRLVDNSLVGSAPIMENSRIVFQGTGNVLYCEEGVKLTNSTIAFKGSDSVVALGSSKHSYRLGIDIFNSSTFAVGGGATSMGNFTR